METILQHLLTLSGGVIHQRKGFSTMLRSLLALSIIFLTYHPAAAEENATVPKEFVLKMKSMVGSWVFNGKEGDRKFSGREKIQLVNNETALLQMGYFDLGEGEKEHYTILSGWDPDKKSLVVNGYTSESYAFSGEWKSVNGNGFIGTANGKPATFTIHKETMEYNEDGGSWVMNFKRTEQQ